MCVGRNMNGEEGPRMVWTSRKKHWMLCILCCVHLFAEFGHFLIGVVSKDVAHDVHFGSQACMFGSSVKSNETFCSARNKTSCEALNSGGEQLCVWDFTGTGLEYQLLVGPYYMAVFTTAAIVWGYLADRQDRILLIFSATFFTSFSLGLTGLSTSFWHLTTFRMMLALGVAGVTPLAPSLVFDIFDTKERGIAMGIFHWGVYLGYGLTYLVGTFLTKANVMNLHWRGTFFICALPGILTSMLILWSGEDPPRRLRPSEASSRSENETSLPNNSDSETEVLFDASSESDPPSQRDSNGLILSNEGLGDEIANYTTEQSLLISSSYDAQNAVDFNTTPERVWLQGYFLFLVVGACIRHIAGFTWSYNSALYFRIYYPNREGVNLYLTLSTIIGGPLGVALGGFLSDRLVSFQGIPARALVLFSSQMIAAPFALGVLKLEPPVSFACLILTYIFGEMWYGVLFTIFLELVPLSFRSIALSVGVFVMNNVGGNVPVLLQPLQKYLRSYREALILMFPGGYLISSILFLVVYVLLRRSWIAEETRVGMRWKKSFRANDL